MNKLALAALAILGTGLTIFAGKKIYQCVKTSKMEEEIIKNNEEQTEVVEPEIVESQESTSEENNEEETPQEEVEESTSSEETNTAETEEVK